MADELQATNEPIAAEEDEYFNDADSALGTPSLASSTTSIGDSIMQYRKENGRTYHAYKEGKYIFPNDEAENDRLDLQHHLFALTFKNKLFLSPAGKQNILHRVLDVGTGTGIWAMDFADEHPESQVIGIDLSPIQPSFIPANVIFQIDDLEEAWTFKHKFDFIYSRMMNGSFADWPRFFEQAYENLNPGGFLELCDSSLPLENEDNTWPENSALKKWGDSMIEGIKKFGRSAESPFQYEAQLKAAGFINIKKIEYKWPTNSWPKDKKLKELGLWNYENLCGGLGGISLRTFTQGLGWSLEETEAFLVDVRREFKDTRIHSYMPLFVIWGQKPPEA